MLYEVTVQGRGLSPSISVLHRSAYNDTAGPNNETVVPVEIRTLQSSRRISPCRHPTQRSSSSSHSSKSCIVPTTSDISSRDGPKYLVISDLGPQQPLETCDTTVLSLRRRFIEALNRRFSRIRKLYRRRPVSEMESCEFHFTMACCCTERLPPLELPGDTPTMTSQRHRCPPSRSTSYDMQELDGNDGGGISELDGRETFAELATSGEVTELAGHPMQHTSMEVNDMTMSKKRRAVPTMDPEYNSCRDDTYETHPLPRSHTQGSYTQVVGPAAQTVQPSNSLRLDTTIAAQVSGGYQQSTEDLPGQVSFSPLSPLTPKQGTGHYHQQQFQGPSAYPRTNYEDVSPVETPLLVEDVSKPFNPDQAVSGKKPLDQMMEGLRAVAIANYQAHLNENSIPFGLYGYGTVHRVGLAAVSKVLRGNRKLTQSEFVAFGILARTFNVVLTGPRGREKPLELHGSGCPPGLEEMFQLARRSRALEDSDAWRVILLFLMVVVTLRFGRPGCGSEAALRESQRITGSYNWGETGEPRSNPSAIISTLRNSQAEVTGSTFARSSGYTEMNQVLQASPSSSIVPAWLNANRAVGLNMDDAMCLPREQLFELCLSNIEFVASQLPRETIPPPVSNNPTRGLQQRRQANRSLGHVPVAPDRIPEQFSHAIGRPWSMSSLGISPASDVGVPVSPSPPKRRRTNPSEMARIPSADSNSSASTLASSSFTSMTYTTPLSSAYSSTPSPIIGPYGLDKASVTCPYEGCHRVFVGETDWLSGNVRRHMNSVHLHTGNKLQCAVCPKMFKRSDATLTHERKEHPELMRDPPKRRKSPPS